MDQSKNGETVNKQLLGYLRGHNGEITALAAGHPGADEIFSKIFISASRDKTILIWKINSNEEEAQKTMVFGEPWICLKGHNHFVSDLTLTKDNFHLFSSSWDKTIRIWDVKTGRCQQTFASPAVKEITSVTISADSRKVFSSGLQNSIALWTTKGKFVEASKDRNHQDWVSKVRYSPSTKNDYLASVGWDGKLKIWFNNLNVKASFEAHDGPINALAIASGGPFIATGGKDQFVKVWRVSSLDKVFQVSKCNSTVNDICFNPMYKFFAVATNDQVLLYALNASNTTDEKASLVEPALKIEKDPKLGKYTSVAWASNSKHLFCGTSSGTIAVYRIDIK